MEKMGCDDNALISKNRKNICDELKKTNLYEHNLETTLYFQNMETVEIKSSKKTATVKYECEVCEYNTYRKYNFNKHLSTPKHQMEMSGNQKVVKIVKVAKAEKVENIFKCSECNKSYLTRSGLWKHAKQCNIIQNKVDIEVNNENINYKELLITALKQNNELQEFLIKQSQQHSATVNQIIPKIGTTNNTINNNQKLNINVFLNEQCKDAISMDAFVDSIDVTIPNLLITKDKGLVEGLSNIIIENMSKLPITQRPIHCTDVKRETIYIKSDIWEKDTDQVKTKEAIKKVSCKQIKGIKKWTEANPNYMQSDKLKEEFNYLVKHSTDDIKDDKIIKNLCKTSYINEKLIENE